MKDWRNWVRGGFLIFVIVAVLAGAAWVAGLFDGDNPSQSAPSAPARTEILPQEGYVNSIVVGANTLSCDEKTVASTTLVLDGMVDDNGTIIAAHRAQDGVTIIFTGNNVALSGIVNRTVGFNVPDAARGTGKPPLFLATKNFGEIRTLTLCGGGR